MTPTKELFLKRTEMRDRLLAVVKQDWFEESLLYVQALTMEGGNVTPDFVRGANAFKDVLLTLADEAESLPRNICSGLCHDIDDPKKAKAKKEDPNQEKA